VKTLRTAGFQVVAAKTGADAVRACQRQQFHAIALDLLLPDMRGVDALSEIRKLKGYAKVPVIIVSVSSEDTVRATQATWCSHCRARNLPWLTW
jgi:DNA-binding response OmpR family regulator